MRQGGFSLVELVVVVAIMAVLLSLATLNWNRMQTKSAIENEVKTLHADLMEVRLQALYQKTSRSVVIAGQTVTVYPTDTTSGAPVSVKSLAYPVVPDGGGTLTLTFDTQGLLSPSGTRALCVVPTGSLSVPIDAAVDSLIITDAQINIGLRTTGVTCESGNITQK